MENEPISRLDRLEARMDTLESDVKSIKGSISAVEDMAETVSKLYTWVKRGLPLIATAAVTSGLVSGRWGAFFQALFH